MDLIKYGKVIGYLKAFEQLNYRADGKCTYNFENLPCDGSAVSSVKKHLKPNLNYSITLENLTEGEQILLSTLERWFFGEFDENSCKAQPEPMQCNKEYCLNQFTDLIRELFNGEQPKISRLHISSNDSQELNPPYEAYWDDFVFENNGELFLLHLGISD